MISKKALSPEEQLLAKTLNSFERDGYAVVDTLMPKLDFAYNEKEHSTRVFSEIRMDDLNPELKTFVLSAMEKSGNFSVELTRDGSPYDCAIFERSVKGCIEPDTAEGKALYARLRDGLEESLQSHASEVRSDLYGKGFPVRLPNPFSDLQKDKESVFAKFRNRMRDRDSESTPTMA